MPFDLLNPTPEHRLLRSTLRRFAEQEVAPRAAEADREERFDRALFDAAAELGVLGVTVPEEWGGAGCDATAAVIVCEELAAADPGFTLAVLSHAILFANHLARNGSDDQRRRFLPDACAGRIVAGMAMSEHGAGTDVMAMTTRARRDGDAYVLDGGKMWITNGILEEGVPGDIFLVYAKTGEGGPRSLSLFLVEKDTPGFRVGHGVSGRLGVRASKSAELWFEGCQVPIANRVGEEGAALLHMMRTLEIERLTMAAMGLGIARRAVEVMNGYASERHAFGQPLRAFGQIQRHLAESWAELAAGRAYVYQTALGMDLDRPCRPLDADGAKLYCATMAKNVADRAIQVLGAYGYSGESVVQRLWRDAKLLEIGGGTLEAHQRNMTRALARLRKID